MKLKKLAKCSLATALILGSVGAISGCKKDNDNNTIEKTYDLYVQYLNAKGDTPLTYEQWLASIKGEKGDPGKDAIAPKVRINETTNYWEISTDNGTTWTSTGVKATGAEGEKGDPGNDAIAPQVRINQDTKYWEISTDNGTTWISTGVKATGNEGHTPEITIGQNGNWFVDGEDTHVKAKGEDASFETYSITFDYGKAKQFFDNAIDTHEIKSTEWLTNLPTIKSQYNSQFLGWFIIDTNKKIEKFDFIGGDVTLEARFVVNENAPSGLYQNGKYTLTWSELKAKYSGAFNGNEIVVQKLSQSPYNRSYFLDLSGELVIDSSVTKIGFAAFEECDGITSIIMPSTITEVDSYAFYFCDNLEKVVLSENIERVGRSAFASLTDSIQNVVEYENGFYLGTDENPYMILISVDEEATEVTIHEDCEIMAEYAFSSANITSITVPSNIKTIPAFAFHYSSDLEEIIIEEGVENIENNAFDNCYNLVNISIPNTIENIGYLIFSGYRSNKLEVTSDEHGVYLGNDTNPYLVLLSPKAGIETLVIHEDCKIVITQSATSWESEIYTSVVIPNSVEFIGQEGIGSSYIDSIYYHGSASEWSNIDIHEKNKLNSTIYYYSETEPTLEGNYWHYDTDGTTPVVWVQE